MTAKEKADFDQLNIKEDPAPAVLWAYICQAISQQQNVPFNEAHQIAQERFPSLWAQTPAAQGANNRSPGGNTTAVSNGDAAGYSTLLGCDVADVSPAEAGEAFKNEVSRLQKERNLGFTDAWGEARRVHPKVHDRMQEAMRDQNNQTALEHAKPLPNALNGAEVPPAQMPFARTALGLPATATNEETNVAFTANGRQIAERRPESILTALLAHLMGKNNWNIDAAKDEASRRYPVLWEAAGDKPAAPRT